MKKKFFIVLLILIIFVLSGIFDCEVSQILIQPQPAKIWIFVYKYFNIVPISLIFITFVLYLYSLLHKKTIVTHRNMFFIITFLIASQGLVHLSKKYTGRPRPREIVEFNQNGKFLYSYPWHINTPKTYPIGQSFPSGHAGFSFFTIFLYFIFRHKKYSSLFLYFSILYGSFVGFGRIIQGAHFFSDVVGSFIFVYISGEILYLILCKKS